MSGILAYHLALAIHSDEGNHGGDDPNDDAFESGQPNMQETF